VHIVINKPDRLRPVIHATAHSTLYCSSAGQMIDAPGSYVSSADDPGLVSPTPLRFHAGFSEDVVVDIIASGGP
jgi:2-oxoglutarate dehydrogenase complex dehydrogenase (E1) component-like enzyme